MFNIDNDNATIKNVINARTVHVVNTFVVSLPNALSAAPPPNDAPIPELADGRCIRITTMINRLVHTNTNVKINVKNPIITHCTMMIPIAFSSEKRAYYCWLTLIMKFILETSLCVL